MLLCQVRTRVLQHLGNSPGSIKPRISLNQSLSDIIIWCSQQRCSGSGLKSHPSLPGTCHDLGAGLVGSHEIVEDPCHGSHVRQLQG